MHHPVASGPSGSICSQSRPVCAHFRVLCSQPTAEWEEVSTTSVPQLLSHSMGAVPLGHTKELSGTGSSYILLLPASKGAPLEHFCCRTLLLLQGEGGGCRTLKSYRQGFAFWRGTCNLPLPAACTPQPGVSAIPPQPRAACASLCCCTRLCRGCTCHIFKLLLPAWAWIWSPARQGKQGMSNCCFFSTASDKEFHPCRLSGMPGQAGETMHLCAWDSSCGQRLGVWSGGLF